MASSETRTDSVAAPSSTTVSSKRAPCDARSSSGVRAATTTSHRGGDASASTVTDSTASTAVTRSSSVDAGTPSTAAT
ncbi:hypothetical protein BRC92_01815 [Halobacteriales archaeon QS_4_69_31]|nr:MAG: hypothetical protein BRC92_01815 [Halobacteriales archaeon QS_4_69_31]